MKPLQGIIVSLVTPFTVDQQPDLAAMRRLVRFLLRAGIHGLYVTGSAGEWVRLRTDERKRILETVIDETQGRIPVVAHVGHYSTSEAVELAGHAAHAGVDYISSVVPGYYGYTPDEIGEYYKAIAGAGAPVIVNILEGARELNPRDFVGRFAGMEGVVGLKYTAADLFPMQAVHDLSNGRLRVWTGQDQMALAGFAMDSAGAIGTNFNYLPEIYVELYSAYAAGNLTLAQALQREANRIQLVVKQFGNLPAYRAVLALRGLPVGDCRLPTRALRTDEQAQLERAIEPFRDRLRRIA